MRLKVVMKRVKRRIAKCPNPLFESWLKEWKEEAKRNGSEMQYCFGRALKSLKKYPLRLESGKECFILENFGAKLCMMLDKKLTEYKKLNSDQELDPIQEPTDSVSPSVSEVEEADSVPISAAEADTLVCVEKQNLEELNVARHEKLGKRKCIDSPNRTCKVAQGNKSVKTTTGHEKKVYLPVYKSTSYAVLLTLYKNNNQMTKTELETEALELCHSPVKKQLSDSNSKVWGSVIYLSKKGLVERNGRPPRVSLTAKGIETVLELKSLYEINIESRLSSECASHSTEIESHSNNDHVSEYPNFNLSVTVNSFGELEALCGKDTGNKQTNMFSSNSNSEKLNQNKVLREENILNNKRKKILNSLHEDVETFAVTNAFDIILYVDNKEIESKQNAECDKTVKYLKKKNVNVEVKLLNVGDYIWVARDKVNNEELVLPYIVERKRIDDLASSIRDGRFHEQKFRLKSCGIQNVIYLVEKHSNDSLRLGLPLQTIQQAVSNTRIIDGFNVKLTNNNDESLHYLCLMTNFFTRIFRGKTLMSYKEKDLPVFNLSDDVISLMPFSYFNKNCAKMKKFTVRNMLVKQLLQLNGLSVEKAKAIVKLYPTPKSLMEALRSSSGETAIASITCGALNRSVGSAIAKSLHHLYTSPRLN